MAKLNSIYKVNSDFVNKLKKDYDRNIQGWWLMEIRDECKRMGVKSNVEFIALLKYMIENDETRDGGDFVRFLKFLLTY